MQLRGAESLRLLCQLVLVSIHGRQKPLPLML